MFILLLILSSFLFSSNKYEIEKITSINKVNYYTLIDSSIYVIYDEFYDNKLYIKKIYNDKKLINSIENFKIEQFENLDTVLFLSKNDFIYSYNLKTQKYNKIISTIENNDSKRKIKFINENHILINSNFYFNGVLFDENVDDIILFNNHVFYITNYQGKLLLKDMKGKVYLRLESSDRNSLSIINNKLSINNIFEDRILISIINSNFEVDKYFWINSKNEFQEFNNRLYFYDFIDLKFKEIDQSSKVLFEFDKIFEEFIISEYYLGIKSNNSIKIYDHSGDLKGVYNFKDRVLDFKIINDDLYIQFAQNLDQFVLYENNLWLFEEFYQNYLYLIIYLILLYYLLKFWLKYRDRQIIFHTIFDLTSTGLILHINEKGELKNLNQNARRVLLLPDSVVLGDFYKKYIKQESLIELSDLINKALNTKLSLKQKIIIKENNEIIDLMCNINTIQNITGKFKGILINAVDISEELESKRMSNWAQLAHDMQTNLSTIKLNAEQLNLNDEVNQNRQKKIIHQTNLLVKRIRDIVTVGRSNNLNKSLYAAEEIYNDLISEFDIESYSLIEFKHSIEKFNFICDKEKIIRALRNAFENAIKIFDGKEGVIEVIIKRDARNVYFIIKDSGIGMDDETIRKMKDPYFTTKGEKGGSGIGTIIMQKVMEQHGGEFIIQSKINVGTEIIFKIPYLKS